MNIYTLLFILIIFLIIRNLIKSGDNSPKATNKQQHKNNQISVTPPPCPYCNKIMKRVPKRKTKCPSCGEPVYVREMPNSNKPIFVTEDDKKRIDNIIYEHRRLQDLADMLMDFGYSSQQFHKYRDNILKKTPDMKDEDIALSLMRKAMKKKRKSEYASSLYYQMALFACEHGREFKDYLTCSHIIKLNEMKNEGVTKVCISTAGRGNACSVCNKLNRKKFNIDYAIKNDVLPHPRCTMDLYENGNSGFCRCTYLSVD